MEHSKDCALFTLEQEIKLAINERLFAGGFITATLYEKAKVLLVKEQLPRQNTYQTGRVS